jgi:hypothetical protein
MRRILWEKPPHGSHSSGGQAATFSAVPLDETAAAGSTSLHFVRVRVTVRVWVRDNIKV